MKKNIFFIVTFFCLFFSCSKEDDGSATTNKVLMLKVDYLTNTFEGGIETGYPAKTATFTTSNQYKPPSDFGNLKIKYQELDEILFDGDIIWAGKGKINLPQNILPANQFTSVTTADVVNPVAGFEDIFNPYNQAWNYTPVWLAIQKLTKVREYVNANPNATVKLFLYTPSVGFGDPADWDWIIFMKN
jgi:hypothetical protein